MLGYHMCILSLRYFDGTCSFELDDINNIYIFYHPIFNVPTITIFATALSSFTATTFMGRCFIHVCVCMGRRLLMICMCVIFVVAPTRTHPLPSIVHYYTFTPICVHLIIVSHPHPALAECVYCSTMMCFGWQDGYGLKMVNTIRPCLPSRLPPHPIILRTKTHVVLKQ
jgi:hypothetical protein